MQDQYFGGNYVRKLHFTNVLTGIKVEMRAAGQFGTSHPPCIIDINAGDKGGGGVRTLAHSFHINHILFSARRYHPWPENFSIPEMDSLPSPSINYANNFLSPQESSTARSRGCEM